MIRKILCCTSVFLIFTMCLEINSHRIKDSSSIEDHINRKEHDPTMDHEAFLGTEESKAFDKLSPEQSKLKLKNIIETKVDIDGNGLVTVEELKQWITYVGRLSKEKERDEYFPMFKNSTDYLLDYDSYLMKIYGGLKVDQLDDISKDNLAIMQMQDKRKWKVVDENHDNKLDRNEILVFQHPEDYPKMKALVIKETMEVSDKNKDGFLDLNEYLNDIWPSKEGIEEQLIEQEKETFSVHRDINKDKKLDLDEVGQWLMPADYDVFEAETRHLFYHADTNKDGQLSIDEIMESFDLFVGSQATDYGKHEEL